MQYKKQNISFFIFLLLNFLFNNIAHADVDLMSLDYIKARIKPVGEVNIVKPGELVKPLLIQPTPQSTSPSTASNGQKIYDKYCSVCHLAGVAGAPKFKDVAAWESRLKKGMDILFGNVKKGFNAMPPKGTCVECSDEDLKAAIEYMTKNSK